MAMARPGNQVAAGGGGRRGLGRGLGGLQFLQLIHFAQVFEHLHGFFFVHPADGETHMHDHVVAHAGFRDIGQIYFLLDAAKADLARALQGVFVGDAFEPAWNT
jgi:hypothetical protein